MIRLKILKLLTATGISLGLLFSPLMSEAQSAAKVPDQPRQDKHDIKELKEHRGGKLEFRNENPVNALEKKKQHIQSLVKEGKLTKEKADKIISRIDSRIKAVKEFDKLTLTEKKQKLKDTLRSNLEKRQRAGRLTREKMDEIISEFDKKIDAWDGKGYPGFFFGKGPHKPELDKSR